MTELLFRDDAYCRECAATVLAVRDGAVILDRTVFYPLGGGQPGDTGSLRLEDGSVLDVVDTRKGAAPDEVLHLLAPDMPPPAPGAPVTAVLDWERRHRLMRTHSSLHLLCRAVDGVVTGGQVGDLKGRLDFDIPEAVLDKEALTGKLAEWVAADRPISASWVSEEELDARPELVRTMSVQPPRGHGRIRLIAIEGIDLQACGGTHVRSTGEIGRITVTKIEKKGRQNRRVAVTLEP